MSKITKLLGTNKKTINIVRNVFAAFIMRGGALLISLFSMPAFITFFDDQTVLGVWFTVLSVITWILNFDLGIGNGLRNNLVVSLEAKNDKRSKELISSAYTIIGLLVAVLIIAGLFLSPLIPWNRVFNISELLVSSDILLQVVQSVFIGIMLQFFLRLISSVLYSLQKSAINNAISLVISFLQLLFVLIISPGATPMESLLLLSRAYIIITALPYLLATVTIFLTSLKHIKPNPACCTKSAVTSVMSLGGIYFLCQIFYMIIVNTNDFFITYFTQPEKTVEYNIYYRLFSIAGTLAALALSPVWSMVTKAVAEGDYSWIRKLFKKAQILAGVSAIGQFLMVVVLQFAIDIWLKDNAIKVNYVYAFVFATWGAIFVYHNVLSTFTCGIGKMKLQAVCYGIGILFKFLFILVIYQFTESWVFVVLSNLLLMIPYCVLQQRALNREFSK